MATLTVYANAGGDGQVEAGGTGTHASYVSASSGTAESGVATGYAVGDEYYSGSSEYYIHRAFFPFDTSALGAGATINSATLSIKTSSVVRGTASFRLVQTTQASSTALVGGDFDQSGSTAGASDIRYDTLSTNTYFDMALNATGLSWINTTGYTNLGLRDATHDIGNSAPTGVDGLMNVNWSDQTDVTSDPKLVIDYTPGPVTTTVKGYQFFM